jgi:hypothetical protein
VDAGAYHIAWQFLLLFFFSVALYVTRFFIPEELDALRRLMHRRSLTNAD